MKSLGETLHEQKGSDESESNGEQATLSVTDVSSAKSVRARLPKLEIQKFDGKSNASKNFGIPSRARWMKTLPCRMLTNFHIYVD